MLIKLEHILYVLVNIKEESYLDDDGYLTKKLEEAGYWKIKENIKYELTTLDFPEDFIIKTIKRTYELLD